MPDKPDPRTVYKSKEDMLLHKMFIKFGLSEEQCNEALRTIKTVMYDHVLPFVSIRSSNRYVC